MKISIEKSVYILLFIILSAVIMMEAGVIIQPLAFAFIAVSIFLKPAQWLEKKGMNRFWSVFTAMVTGSILVALFGFFLTRETVQVMSTLKSSLNIENPSESIANEINNAVPGNWLTLTKDEVANTTKSWMNDFGAPLISNTFKSTGYVISTALLALVYSFLILLYRKGISQVIEQTGSGAMSSKKHRLLQKILKTGQQYIGGLGLLIIILSLLYGITFWLFGIDFPIVFAIVAATLAVIPYIGTTLGASLPVIYSFITYDNHFIALGLIACIMAIQALEGNLLTPKIVGGNMKLNPLASLIAVMVGNFIWGLAGMILFLPMAAMAHIIFKEIKSLKPLADLSGEELTEQD